MASVIIACSLAVAVQVNNLLRFGLRSACSKGETEMRYIVMHKVDLNMEAGVPPDHELVKRMGRLVGESLKQGIFIDGAGLHRSARRVRLRCKGGSCDVERGPYQGENELVESMALIRIDSIDAAV